MENDFLKKQRNEQIRDLRETYKRQAAEKKERERTFMKEWNQNEMKPKLQKKVPNLTLNKSFILQK